LTSPSQNAPHLRQITSSSCQQMIDLAEAFFKQVNAAMADGFGVKDFESAKQVLRNATKPNHLR
jgi:hypothetical protein